MSYCVNCGVELDKSAKECPLCNTQVVNPREMKQEYPSPFAKEKGNLEPVKRKDLAILLSVVLSSTAVICGLLNLLVYKWSAWSLAIIGACVLIWLLFVPVVVYTKQPIYLSLLLDGGGIALYLYLIARMVNNTGWFYELGLPITVLVTVIVELFTLCVRTLSKAFLSIGLYAVTSIGLLCTGLESIIDCFLYEEINLLWSGIVATICVVIDGALITMMSRRRLRNAVRRRLHF